MSTPRSVTERYKNITGIDVAGYLTDYVNFMENDRSNVIAYYSGSVKKPNAGSFKKLDELLKRASILNSSIRQNTSRFLSAEDWDLLEKIESVRTTLFTTDEASRWLRSSITKGNFTPNPETDHALKQNETLEMVSRNVVNSTNHNNDYVDIALRNDLKEEDYTNDGGVILKVNLQAQGGAVRINSVVDNMIGERLYGLDLNRRLTFNEEDSDFAVLSFRDTVLQAIDILAGLRRNDNPEYPDDGINSSLVAGSNRNALLFPLLFRQLYGTFQKDDTLSSFSITNIKFKEDYLHLEYEVQTKLGETIQNSIAV